LSRHCGSFAKASEAPKKASEAAQLSAEALINAERARIFIIIEQDTADSIRAAAKHANSTEKDGDALDSSVGLYYGLKNYGKTPAIIKEISQQLVLAPQLAKEREYSPKTPLPIEPTLGPGEQTPRGTLVCSLDRKITVGEAKEILTLKNALWFYGYVAYDDTFGFGRELRYIFRYDGSTGGRFRLHSFQEFQSRIRHQDYVPVDRSRRPVTRRSRKGGFTSYVRPRIIAFALTDKRTARRMKLCFLMAGLHSAQFGGGNRDIRFSRFSWGPDAGTAPAGIRHRAAASGARGRRLCADGHCWHPVDDLRPAAVDRGRAEVQRQDRRRS
jgi:hypothetical protein